MLLESIKDIKSLRMLNHKQIGEGVLLFQLLTFIYFIYILDLKKKIKAFFYSQFLLIILQEY